MIDRNLSDMENVFNESDFMLVLKELHDRIATDDLMWDESHYVRGEKISLIFHYLAAIGYITMDMGWNTSSICLRYKITPLGVDNIPTYYQFKELL